MKTLIFDIETVGEDFNALDATTQAVLTKWIRKDAENEAEYERELENLKSGLGFSPLTGEIAVIGVYDLERDQGVIYYQAPGEANADQEEGKFKFRRMTEKEMLAHFWQGAAEYRTFVSYNGRAFDVPFLMIRSAIHSVRPSKNLLKNRYLNNQPDNAAHIDLQDQLTFYGAMRKKGGLHLFSRAFGIKSPKGEGITGEDVSAMFRDKKYLEIARYNTGDLIATAKLYEYWKNYLDL